MNRLITERDRDHLGAFPATQRARILQEIMSRTPSAQMDLSGAHDSIRVVSKLRLAGMGLIDFQPYEMGFTSIWYREKTSCLGLLRTRAAALVLWQYRESEDELTSVAIWNI